MLVKANQNKEMGKPQTLHNTCQLQGEGGCGRKKTNQTSERRNLASGRITPNFARSRLTSQVCKGTKRQNMIITLERIKVSDGHAFGRKEGPLTHPTAKLRKVRSATMYESPLLTAKTSKTPSRYKNNKPSGENAKGEHGWRKGVSRQSAGKTTHMRSRCKALRRGQWAP